MRKGQGLVEYTLLLVLVAIVIFVMLAIVGRAVGPTSQVSGVVIKTYALSCNNCTSGFATIRLADGSLKVIEMSSGTYGLVSVDDYCTFDVSMDYARAVKCEPGKER